MATTINYPYDSHYLLRKKKAIRRDLLHQSELLDKRIAILGGSTTAEVKDMLEIFLLQDGIRPVFYESEYNQYFEDLIFPNPSLNEFAPDIVYIHTTNLNIKRFPSFQESNAEIDELLSSEVSRFKLMWDSVATHFACPIIQNNFELPYFRGLGNLDGYDIHGRARYVSELNLRFAEHARGRSNLYLNDINYLAAWFGLERWYDKHFWYSYKYAMNYEAIPILADSVASIIKAIYGKTKKCLVLDLDNTLWGGVIGDDGVNGIQIGKETPEAEAFSEFQQYCRMLKERGIILAVCSKNEERNAHEGFAHPDSILKLEDFSAFKANWEPKYQNIRSIAQILNIGIDSLVFADDNPVEREIVQIQEPEVKVPVLGSDVAHYINILDKTGYFEPVSLSSDDVHRSSFYDDNKVRQKHQGAFLNYEDFLRSLEMKAEIKPFVPIYLDRITQLINKTNQFNLTTRRYTQSEVEEIANKSNYITLYGRLRDKFGDNGLISIIVGEVIKSAIHIDLWLMSCRVLKRGMEDAMFQQLVSIAKSQKITTIYGYYYPTSKNKMVSGLLGQMGFNKKGDIDSSKTTWQFEIPKDYTIKKLLIEVTQ
ncbi:MAG: HAD-IIIC family phosphatase [Chlorobiaceae bacterium]